MTTEEYWSNRQLEAFTEGEKSALELAKRLKVNYDASIVEIDKEIAAFYGKFARENGITLQEAKKLLDKSELKSFKVQLQEYMDYAKEHEFDKNYINELSILKYRTNISRLEQLKANIKFQLAKLMKKDQDEILSTMLEEYDFSYLNSIFSIQQKAGISFMFAKPAAKVIEKYLSQNLNIGNYAIGKDQIWEYKIPKLMEILNIKIPQGIILGQNPKKVAKLVADPVEKDYNNIVRLVRTEYNYIFNQAAFDAYEAAGMNQYQILATLDERTCNTCGPLDLLVVYLKDKEIGVNHPPFHPNCRCTTIAYFEPDEFDKPRTRVARDKEGKTYKVPYNLTYNEWKQGLTEHKGGVLYWKPKGA